MKPEQRLADALDAVAPGADDLVDETLDQAISQLETVLAEIRDAIMDVMLGPVVDEAGKRAQTGINTYIQHHGALPVPLIRLVAWQNRLNQALNKL